MMAVTHIGYFRTRTKPQFIQESPRIDTRSAAERAAERWSLDYPIEDRKHLVVMATLRDMGAANQTVAEARADSEAISLKFAERNPRRWQRMARIRGIDQGEPA